MQWEYLTTYWAFVGPIDDEWPGYARYVELMDQQKVRKAAEKQAAAERDPYGLAMSVPFDPDEYDVLEGPEGDDLIRQYLQWRIDEEHDYLNEFGAAGFELVSISRHQGPITQTMPQVDVFAYFKRPVMPDAPPPPSRTIGFQVRKD